MMDRSRGCLSNLNETVVPLYEARKQGLSIVLIHFFGNMRLQSTIRIEQKRSAAYERAIACDTGTESAMAGTTVEHL
jgi:hypothetical protein